MTDPPIPPGVEMVTHPAADHLGGACYLRLGDRAIIVVSPSLDETQRRCAIEHELEHHELGVVEPPAHPLTMQTAERNVRRAVHRRLVPLELLADLAAEDPDQPVTTGMVMEAFQVDPAVAQDALDRLRARWDDGLVT